MYYAYNPNYNQNYTQKYSQNVYPNIAYKNNYQPLKTAYQQNYDQYLNSNAPGNLREVLVFEI
jgi:hypothetical protein